MRHYQVYYWLMGSTELLTPVMNSVFDSSEIDDQVLLPPEPFNQTKADLLMEGILTGVQSEVEISSDPDSVLEIPNGNPYCPVTGDQRDGVLDTAVIPGTTLIINRGTLLPDALKEKALFFMRDDE